MKAAVGVVLVAAGRPPPLDLSYRGGGFVYLIVRRFIAAASVIWELDSWSLAKQSGIYFLIVSVIMLPVAYIANWMNHSAAGILSYTGIFVAIFIAVWLVQYFIWKMKIKKMNAVVNKEDNL